MTGGRYKSKHRRPSPEFLHFSCTFLGLIKAHESDLWPSYTLSTMLGRAVALALAGSAAAFSPMMSLETGRRQVVQAGAAGAVAAPLLRANPAAAYGAMTKDSKGNPNGAPKINIFDHRGCTAHQNTEYRGEKSNDQDDEMCVMVSCPPVKVSDVSASKFLQQNLSYQAKGIDGPYLGRGKQ